MSVNSRVCKGEHRALSEKANEPAAGRSAARPRYGQRDEVRQWLDFGFHAADERRARAAEWRICRV